jgi:hypothetical protein
MTDGDPEGTLHCRSTGIQVHARRKTVAVEGIRPAMKIPRHEGSQKFWATTVRRWQWLCSPLPFENSHDQIMTR